MAVPEKKPAETREEAIARLDAAIRIDRARRYKAMELAAEAMDLSLDEFEGRLRKPGDLYRDQREKYEHLIDRQLDLLLDDRD
ncbi:MAG: hypothetical protein UT26_C0042G0006 [Microgenomates group bacterium GW2011_GWC1_39_12]|nr:MAG: hypothetical protein UT26_C0042G0006 [Microgenomates group bacterium GW2011_GWC1_39_12]